MKPSIQEDKVAVLDLNSIKITKRKVPLDLEENKEVDSESQTADVNEWKGVLDSEIEETEKGL